MKPEAGYVLEDEPEGRTLVVTGAWSREAEELLARGDADGLVLNYARGFCEGNLEFLDSRCPVRRLNVLDRGITDLEPIGRLRDSLQALSVQAAPNAELDLGDLPDLRSVAGEWDLISGTLGRLDALQSVITWRFDEADLRAFRDHLGLTKLVVKEAPFLETLAGVEDLHRLTVLQVIVARELVDISAVTELGASLRELEFEGSPEISSLDGVEQLIGLTFLGIGDCGRIDSLGPVGALANLEALHAWGSTRIVDGDLSPLMRLSYLTDLRMRDRREYRPRLSDVQAKLGQGAGRQGRSRV